MGKFACYVLLAVGAGLVVLAGCGGSSVPVGGSQQISAARWPPAHKRGYRVVYAFQGGMDGEYPAAALLAAGKRLYGTTSSGGDPSCQSVGCGTIFEAGLKGKYRVLHRFEGASQDGAFPYAPLTWGFQGDESALFGTTCCGGAESKAGNGTVFVMIPYGKEKLIHRFRRSNDGAFSSAKLVGNNGPFYGTTRYGGTGKSCYSGRGCGTVFTIDELGRERVLHSFQGGSSGDGATPYASVTPLRDAFYGTTAYGGSNGQGTIFVITRTGKERVLYSFGGPDGATPVTALIVVHGVLYGTTTFGGTGSACGSQGCGTVFSITTAGKERVLYSFGTASNDGENPAGDLVAVGGKLYGTTDFGGTSGYGVIFSATSGGESVLHDFTGGTDGALPGAGLIEVDHALYGVTTYGGDGKCTGSGFGGCGTIFRVTP